MRTQEELIADYLRHVPGSSDEYIDACQELDELVLASPADALTIVRTLLTRATTAEMRSYVAAGPLENLLAYRAQAVLPLVEAAAQQDPVLRHALSEVWLGDSVPEDVRTRVLALTT